MLIYWLCAFVRPHAAAPRVALAAWVICALIEATQAVHPPWLDALRAHPLAALVLGRGFLWSDLLCYAAGVAMAAGIDASTARRRLNTAR